jgi:hypothetical protein
MSKAPTPRYVGRSPEVTPNKRLASDFDNARDAAMPNASPMAVNPNVPRRMRRWQVDRGCPQRHPNSNFLHSLVDRIRNDRIDAQGSEQKREACESAKQHDEKSSRRYRFINQILEALKFANRQIRI